MRLKVSYVIDVQPEDFDDVVEADDTPEQAQEKIIAHIEQDECDLLNDFSYEGPTVEVLPPLEE